MSANETQDLQAALRQALANRETRQTGFSPEEWEARYKSVEAWITEFTDPAPSRNKGARSADLYDNYVLCVDQGLIPGPAVNAVVWGTMLTQRGYPRYKRTAWQRMLVLRRPHGN